MIISRIEKTPREVFNKNGDKLYLFFPGFFLNKHLFEIYDVVGSISTYQQLLNWMNIKYKGESAVVEEKLQSALSLLNKRGLIDFDPMPSWNNNKTIKREYELIKEQGIVPITQIDIILTRSCNFRCNHCYLNFENDFQDTDELNLEQWKDIIKKLMKQGLESVVITGGEPFTSNILIDLIVFLTENQIYVTLLTNGYLVSQNFIDSMLQYKKLLTIQVSLDGSNPVTHNEQRNKLDAFEKTINAIYLLTNNGFAVVISMTLTKNNAIDVLDGSMFDLVRKLKVMMLGITPHIIMSGNAKKSGVTVLDPEMVTNVINFVHDYNFDNQDPIVSISAPPALTSEKTLSNTDVDRPRCRRGVNSFAVRANGDIVTCSDFSEFGCQEYIYGNINIDDLSDIIYNAKLISEKIMNQFKSIKGVCSICKKLSVCGGACRADAYSKYGDLLGPYPLCQDIYNKGLFPNEMLLDPSNYMNFSEIHINDD